MTFTQEQKAQAREALKLHPQDGPGGIIPAFRELRSTVEWRASIRDLRELILEVIGEDEDRALDELIDEYANELRKIYEGRTAGAYTFEGVLSKFSRMVRSLQK
jgi:hypothetical protein